MFSYYRNHLIKKYNLVKALIDQDTNCVLKVADSNIFTHCFFYKLLRQIDKSFWLCISDNSQSKRILENLVYYKS